MLGPDIPDTSYFVPCKCENAGHVIIVAVSQRLQDNPRRSQQIALYVHTRISSRSSALHRVTCCAVPDAQYCDVLAVMQ